MLNNFFKNITLEWEWIMQKLGLILFLTLIGITQPSHAGFVSILPVGSSLDADPILDVETSPGATIIFDIILDTTGNTGYVTTLTYNLFWDDNELELILEDSVSPPSPPRTGGGFNTEGPSERKITSHYAPDVVVPTQEYLVSRWSFLVLIGLNNDGMIDVVLKAFTEEGANEFGPVNFDSSFENQGLEVQPIPAVPVPAAFWLFGTALIGFIGISRRTKVA
jgi:hypothetical protein